MIEVRISRKLAGCGRPFTLRADFTSNARRVVLFGHSGSGKTLTLHCVAGLARPDEGVITIDGRTLFNAQADGSPRVDIPPRRRNVGYMFQDYALFPHLTVRRNVGFGMERGPWRLGREGRQRVGELLDFFEIGHVADRYPADISGGQRQRVALARALATSPSVLLLDEPFSALDPLLRRRMRDEFGSLLERCGVPALIITHDPDDVDAFAQTLVVYAEGRTLPPLDFATERSGMPSTVEMLEGLLLEGAVTPR